MNAFALEFFYPLQYPAELVDRVETLLKPSLQQWGVETLAALKRHLRKHRTEQTAIQLSGFALPLSHEGEQLFVLLAMKCYRGESRPQFTCFVDTGDRLLAEKNRIQADVQSESVSAKSKTTIVETDAR
jgi:hypothetical protein